MVVIVKRHLILEKGHIFMNTYTLYNEDLEEVLSGDYITDQSGNNGSLENEGVISGKYGCFKINTSCFNNIVISENKFYLTDDTKLFANIEGEMLGFTFMKRGGSSYSCSSIKESRLQSNTFNMFYINNEANTLINYNKHLHNDLMDIIISKTLFDNMFERYPDILRHIDDKINKKYSFTLYENGRIIDHRMQEILNDLKTANLLGNAASMFVEAKTLELFALLSSHDGNSKNQDISCRLRDKMFEAKYIIEKQYNNPPTINELAKHLGICNTTMKEYFKKVFNNTIYGYLLDYRMKKAEELLKNNPELNMFEIALMLGYEHQTNFGVAFKRKYGVSPLEFRNQNS